MDWPPSCIGVCGSSSSTAIVASSEEGIGSGEDDMVVDGSSN